MNDSPSHLTEAERQQVVRYYSEAGPTYVAWSRAYNMHFGYLRTFLQMFRLEAMLQEMSRQVLARLHLAPDAPARVLDMGCGLGAPSRLAVRENRGWRVDAITIVPWQIERARELAAAEGLTERLTFERRDYTASALPTASYDGAYAIESACHDAGLGKEGFIAEAARLIKPGGRLVIADGFYKGGPPTNPLLKKCADIVCANWALETFGEIGAFRDALERHGFVDIEVREISMRIAPSVAYVPWVTLKFLAGELVRSQWRIGALSWGHLRACVLSPVLGMARWRFGYYLVQARRGPNL